MSVDSRRILMAEDDPEDRFIVSECFKDLGCADNIAFAEDGIDLLRSLEDMPACDISLIVLDLNMPRLNGTETLRLLKASEGHRHIPVIIFSTSINEIEKKQCIDLGAVDYVTKPTQWNAYMEACKKLHTMSVEHVPAL